VGTRVHAPAISAKQVCWLLRAARESPASGARKVLYLRGGELPIENRLCTSVAFPAPQSADLKSYCPPGLDILVACPGGVFLDLGSAPSRSAPSSVKVCTILSEESLLGLRTTDQYCQIGDPGYARISGVMPIGPSAPSNHLHTEGALFHDVKEEKKTKVMRQVAQPSLFQKACCSRDLLDKGVTSDSPSRQTQVGWPGSIQSAYINGVTFSARHYHR